MNQLALRPRRLFYSIAALALICALCRSLAFVLAFDRNVGYFDGNAFSTLLYIGLAAGVLLCIAYAFAARKAQRQQLALEPTCPRPTEHRAVFGVIGLLVGLAFIALALREVLALASGMRSVLTMLRLLVAVLALPYFILPSVRGLAYFGLCTPLYGILLLISEYFDHFVTINSPIKLMQLFACFAVMLYFVCELYAFVGKSRPIGSVITAALAVLFGLTNGVSCIVAALVGDIIPADYLLHALLLFTLSIYAGARLFFVAPPACQDNP